MIKVLKYFIFLLITLYVIGCAGLYVAQDDIIFRPTALNDDTSYRWGQEVYIDVGDDVKLHGLYQKRPNSKGAILYLHGNRGNTRWCQRQAETFDGYGMDVLLIDYRGYGKSGGKINSMAQLEEDMDKVYEWLASKYANGTMWVAGYSLGSGLASYLASKYESESLILIAPYMSIEKMKDQFMPLIPDFLIKYPLNNVKYLNQYDGDIAIFHGTEDEVIPYEHAVVLHERASKKVELFTLENTGHRGAIFHSALRNYLSRISNISN